MLYECVAVLCAPQWEQISSGILWAALFYPLWGSGLPDYSVITAHLAWTSRQAGRQAARTGGLWGDEDYGVDCGVMIPLGSGMAVHLYLLLDYCLCPSVILLLEWLPHSLQPHARLKEASDGHWRTEMEYKDGGQLYVSSGISFGVNWFQTKNTLLLTSDRTLNNPTVIQRRSGFEHPDRGTSTHGEKTQWAAAGPATRQAHANTCWGQQKVLLIYTMPPFWIPDTENSFN